MHQEQREANINGQKGTKTDNNREKENGNVYKQTKTAKSNHV